jgi:hypothetical protein
VGDFYFNWRGIDSFCGANSDNIYNRLMSAGTD